MAKTTDKKQTPQPQPAAPSQAGVDPRQVVKVALDAEIAQLKAQLAALEKQGADEDSIERVRGRLSLRAIQRVKLE